MSCHITILDTALSVACTKSGYCNVNTKEEDICYTICRIVNNLTSSLSEKLS